MLDSTDQILTFLTRQLWKTCSWLMFWFQCSRLDAVGFVWELLPAAEGWDRAGLYAGADCRPGPAVLPLLHPLAAGQDHWGSSQQGAQLRTLTKHTQMSGLSVVRCISTTDHVGPGAAVSCFLSTYRCCFIRWTECDCCFTNAAHYSIQWAKTKQAKETFTHLCPCNSRWVKKTILIRWILINSLKLLAKEIGVLRIFMSQPAAEESLYWSQIRSCQDSTCVRSDQSTKCTKHRLN